MLGFAPPTRLLYSDHLNAHLRYNIQHIVGGDLHIVDAIRSLLTANIQISQRY